MSDIVAKIRSMIQTALITRASKDDSDIQTAQCEATGKPLNYANVNPYGLSSNAPKGSSVIRWLLGGSSQNPMGMAFNSENRFKDLKEWEVAIGNFLKKNRIFFDEDGGITIEVVEANQPITVKNANGSYAIESDGTVNINDGNFMVLK